MKRIRWRGATPERDGDWAVPRPQTAALADASADPAQWAAFDDEGLSAEEERLRRRRFARRMRPARTLFAAAVAIGFAAAALFVFRYLGAYAAAFRSLSDRGSVEDIVDFLQAEELRFLAQNHRDVALVAAILLLVAVAGTASAAAGLFTRLYRASGRILASLYGQTSAVGALVFLALVAAVALPYAIDLMWTGALEPPRAQASLGYGIGVASAALIAMRAAQLARRPLPKEPESLPDVGTLSRPSRVAVCARDPLARAAFERLLSANGFVIVFSSEYADETRLFFRRHGRGVDALLLSDDVDDMPQLKLITHLVDEAESAFGLVRLSPESDDDRRLGRGDEPRGRVVAVAHVQTPTKTTPLIEAATRVAEAARRVRDAAAPLSESRGESGAVA